jgi:nucleoside-diphosphate-sugar epimerase
VNILVTGCAGFIGSRVSELLLAEGNEVVGVDNLNDYYDVRLKQHRLSTLAPLGGFSFAESDIEDVETLGRIFSGHRFDAVINLAARAGVRASIESPRVYLSTNTMGSLNLLELIVRHDVPRFVMASTSSLYAGASMPFVETTDVTKPISPYAASKLAAEALAKTWHHLHGIHVAILRYFTVYGPAGRPDMSPFRFIEWIRRGQPIQLYGDGTQTRDFTYIDDIAQGTVAALGQDGCEVFNLGGGNTPITINAMIGLMENLLGRKALVEHYPANSADMHDTAAEISKARQLLGWQPAVDPAEGFSRLVKWHRENADWLDGVRL